MGWEQRRRGEKGGHTTTLLYGPSQKSVQSKYGTRKGEALETKAC